MNNSDDQLLNREKVLKGIMSYRKKNNTPILLWGSSASGKTTLINEINDRVCTDIYFSEKSMPVCFKDKPDKEIIKWIINKACDFNSLIISINNHDLFKRSQKLTGLKGYELHLPGNRPPIDVRNPKV